MNILLPSVPASSLEKKRSALALFLALLACLGLLPGRPAAAAPEARVVLPGHLALVAGKNLAAQGPLDAKQTLTLDLCPCRFATRPTLKTCCDGRPTRATPSMANT